MPERARVLQVPSEPEFELLGFRTVERVPEDGYWCYEAADASGIRIRLSFDIFERSVQVTTFVNEAELSVVSQEGGTVIRVARGNGSPSLNCEFSSLKTRGTLNVSLSPRIHVSWATLQDD